MIGRVAGLLLILRFRALGLWRAFQQNAFVLVVLTPLVFGALIAIVDRFVPVLRSTVQTLLGASAPGPAPVTLVLAVVLTAIGLTGASHEIFPRRGRRLLLDLMPVPPRARYASAWLSRWMAQMTMMTGVLALGWALARTRSEGRPDAATSAVGAAELLSWATHLAVAAAVLGGIEIALVLLLVRLRAWRPAAIFGGSAALSVVALLPAAWISPTVAPVVLAPWSMPAAAMSRVLRGGAGVETGYCPLASPWVAGLSLAASFVGAGWLFARWQRSLWQSALAQSRGGPRRGGRVLEGLLGRMPSAPRALLIRDLLLVLRRFSTAVDVAAIAAVGALGVATLVPRLALSPFWASRVPLLLAAGAVLSTVAIVPFVLRHQLRGAWIERSSGAEPTAIWRAKLWLARILAIVPTTIGCVLVLVLSSGGLQARLLDVLTLVVASWMVASLIGLASFEIAERPALGLVFGGLVAGAFAALLVLYRDLAYFWIGGYFVLAMSVADRATHRVRFTEVARQ